MTQNIDNKENAEKDDNQIVLIKNREPFDNLQKIKESYFLSKTDFIGEFEEAAITVSAFKQMKAILDDNLIQRIKTIENTDLGFQTDRKEGYDIETVRSCVIQAVLTGVKIYGNEFNIICGKLYIAKNGFKGLIYRDKRFTDLVYDIDIPIIQPAEKKAIVSYKATWKFEGKKHSLSHKLTTKWNAGMGDDAVLGKAERKVLAKIWSRSTGSHTSDGEIEIVDIQSSSVPNKNITGFEKIGQENEKSKF